MSEVETRKTTVRNVVIWKERRTMQGSPLAPHFEIEAADDEVKEREERGREGMETINGVTAAQPGRSARLRLPTELGRPFFIVVRSQARECNGATLVLPPRKPRL